MTQTETSSFKFEVGKKYRQRRVTYKYECLYADDTGGLLVGQIEKQPDYKFYQTYFDAIERDFVEVIEPKVTTFPARYLRLDPARGEVWSSSSPAVNTDLCKYEIIHTEGVGVEFKVLEYYGTKK